ncbi:segregation and condensation protein A [Clostridia bacterium]|nr:segregation and condensation protein A [Clostridia bacterium]
MIQKRNMGNTGFTIKLRQFEGPLDLLLHLIDRAQVDIRDILVSDITEQYLSIIRNSGFSSLSEAVDSTISAESAGAFIEMAATLLYIKSRALLPNISDDITENEETPEEALIRQLEEHRRLKAQADQLRELETFALDFIAKQPEALPEPNESNEPLAWTSLTFDALAKAWQTILDRQAKSQQDDIIRRMDAETSRKRMQPTLTRDPYPYEYCRHRLLGQIKTGERVAFGSLIAEHSSRQECLSMFFSLLELIKSGEITAEQHGAFGDIWISAVNQNIVNQEQVENQQDGFQNVG